MEVIYTPDGGDEQRWSFRPKKFPSGEAEAIESATGFMWDEFAQAVLKGSVRARRGLLWVLLRRQHPTIKFADVSFTLDELRLEMELDELQAMRGELEKIEDPNVRDIALRQIDDDIAAAGESPKGASSAGSANATG